MRIAIDCDPGNGIPGANTDDGLALGLAAASSELQLELVTTVAGNVPADVGAAVARELFRAWRVDVPIVAGARTPLVRDPAPWRRVLDREDLSEKHRRLWEGIPRPAPRAAGARATDDGGLTAARALAHLVRANPGEITVVAIGPLTNIALALRLDPGFARHVARIAIMGGAFAVPGRAVDTNFGYDPHAAAAVLASGAPITLVPLDTTVRTLFTAEDLERLRRIDSPIAASLARTTAPWLQYSADTRGIPGCWLHDVLVVAMLIDPTIVTATPARVSVSLDAGAAQGAAVRLPDGGSHDDPRRAPVTLVDGVNNAGLLGVFFGALAS
ncbi:nucleoside hydrolase [Sinomonas sp. P47F7]|uniref:nucleoside hydrolase n=1 Tax=Sinomonas sp. P47F7 TaxID=3410987 RepID=UPI003BF4E58C